MNHSPAFFPLIAYHMDGPDAGVDDHIENALRMASLLVAFTVIHRFYLIKLALNEYLACLGSLPHGHH